MSPGNSESLPAPMKILVTVSASKFAQPLLSRLNSTPGCIETLSRSLVLNSKRARTGFGWKPRYTG